MLMLTDGTWYHSSDMDTKEIIRRIKDGAGWDDLKDLAPPYQQTKIALLHGSGDSPSCSLNE